MHVLRWKKIYLLHVVGMGLLAIFAMGFWAPQQSYAEIYKYVKNEVVYYTNQPPENVAYKTLQFANTLSRSHTRQPSQQALSKWESPPYLNIINKIAKAYQIHPALIKAIIKIESNYNYRAVSPKGAEGLMQLMPATAKRFGVNDSFDPEQNITGGVKFLQYLFNEFGENNLDLVLAGYNAGEEAVRKYGNKIPPYSETQGYVKKVKALYLSHRNYRSAKAPSIYKYVNKDGVITFSNIPRVTKVN